MLRHAMGTLILGMSLAGSSPLPAAESRSEQELAKQIDQLLAARWKAEGVKPVPLAESRKPTPAEARRFVRYVDEGGPSKDARLALADVFWALLNSAEFSLNH